MTNDGLHIPPLPYQAGIDLRDPHGTLTGHLSVEGNATGVKVTSHHYTANAGGLVTAFHALTAEEAEEFCHALRRASLAARVQRGESIQDVSPWAA